MQRIIYKELACRNFHLPLNTASTCQKFHISRHNIANFSSRAALALDEKKTPCMLAMEAVAVEAKALIHKLFGLPSNKTLIKLTSHPLNSGSAHPYYNVSKKTTSFSFRLNCLPFHMHSKLL